MAATAEKTYSESWHRVAHLKLSLRPAVKVRKQLFRGTTWYVLQDPFNNHFYRLEKPAYDFVARLTPSQTVESVWLEQIEQHPDSAPGQDEVIRLLAQLYQANLLFSELPVDSRRLFERYQQRRQREKQNKLFSVMFMRIPLFDPDPLLKRQMRLVRVLTSRWAFGLLLMLLVIAGKALLDQFSQFSSESQQLLKFDNLILLYGGIVLVKTLHELGHTLVCKRFGGEVHNVGIMLIFFAPLPYVDATSSWAFRSRRQRILVASAGMLFEFFAAACAVLVWANSAPGAVHSLALNMFVVASVSTLLFNANPLLRYDGYYILSDLLNIPNLQLRSQEQLKYLALRYLFSVPHVTSTGDTAKESFWLGFYGLLSGSYRLLVYSGIILFVADRYLLLGAMMAVFCCGIWVLLPLGRFLVYLSSGAELSRCRTRAVVVTLSAALLIAVATAVVPFPQHFRVPGVIEAGQLQKLTGATAGRLASLQVESDTSVTAGQTLLLLDNPELEIEIKRVKAQQDEISLLLQQSSASQGDQTRKTLQQQLQTFADRLEELNRRHAALKVKADISGIWVAPDLEQKRGCWIARGETLGEIVKTDQYKFTAVVNQEHASSLFAGQLGPENAAVRLIGFENTELPVVAFTMIPFERFELPSAALGWQGGGDVPTSGADKTGLQTLEPFFEISANLPASMSIHLRHGQSGQIRFSLPSEPLMWQLIRKARQFVQKRYQL